MNWYETAIEIFDPTTGPRICPRQNAKPKSAELLSETWICCLGNHTKAESFISGIIGTHIKIP